MNLGIRITERPDGVQLCALVGNLNAETASDLERKFDALPWPNMKGLILDLRQLEYISSSGLRLFFQARKKLADQQGVLLLIRPPDMVLKVLRMTNMFPDERIVESLSEAEKYLSQKTGA